MKRLSCSGIILAAGILAESCDENGSAGSRRQAVQRALEGELAPGATVVIPMSSGRIDHANVRVGAWPLAAGNTLVQLYGAASAWLLVRADGSILPIGAPALQGESEPEFAASRVVPYGDGALVADCSSNRSLHQLDPHSGAMVEHRDPTGLACEEAVVFGKAAAPDHVVGLRSSGTTLAILECTLGGPNGFDAESVSSWPTDRPATFGRDVPLFVEEVAPGAYEYVYATTPPPPEGGNWVWGSLTSPQAPSAEVSAPALGAPKIWSDPRGPQQAFLRRSPGDFLVAYNTAANGVLFAWDAFHGATIKGLAASPPPAGFSPWDVRYGFGGARAYRAQSNPKEPSLEVPLGYAVRRVVDEGFSVTDAAKTPCRRRASCRRLGESYLLGVVGIPPHEVAVYGFWAWERQDGRDMMGVVATPFRIDDEPIAAGGAGGSSASGGTGGSAGTAGSGGSGGTGGNPPDAGDDAEAEAEAGTSAIKVTEAQGPVAAMALRNDTLYFTFADGMSGGVASVPTAGGTATVELSMPGGVANSVVVDDERMYVLVFPTTGSIQTGSVWSRTYPGGVNTMLWGGFDTPSRLSMDGANLYMLEGQSPSARILGLAKTGGAPLPDIDTGDLRALTISYGYLVYGDAAKNGIVFKPPVPGGSDLIASPATPADIAMDDWYVYWLDLATNAVQRAPRSGAGAPESLAPSGGLLGSSIAVDDSLVYWTNGTEVCAVPKTGGASVVIASQRPQAAPLAVDSAWVYWGENSAVMKAPKPEP